MVDALIWGASGGIGQALVQRLKQEDWRLFAAARDISRIPNEADFTCHFDAQMPGTIDETQILVAQDSQGVDLVVYAAEDLRPDMLKKMKLDNWSPVIDAQLDRGVHSCQSKPVPSQRWWAHDVHRRIRRSYRVTKNGRLCGS
jgi:NADP-dependent 3-hydroxy acid dehydrogenase YdfG